MRIDHVAHPSRDPHATHRFYHDVLGLKLAQAYAGKELLLIYALPGGGSLALATARDWTPAPADNTAWERSHVGLTVPTRAEFDAWLQRLKERAIPYRLIDDERLYFSDPDGLVLELEVAAPASVDPAADEILARWPRTR